MLDLQRVLRVCVMERSVSRVNVVSVGGWDVLVALDKAE
jgi:hypothetical protein